MTTRSANPSLRPRSRSRCASRAEAEQPEPELGTGAESSRSRWSPKPPEPECRTGARAGVGSRSRRSTRSRWTRSRSQSPRSRSSRWSRRPSRSPKPRARDGAGARARARGCGARDGAGARARAGPEEALPSQEDLFRLGDGRGTPFALRSFERSLRQRFAAFPLLRGRGVHERRAPAVARGDPGQGALPRHGFRWLRQDHAGAASARVPRRRGV